MNSLHIHYVTSIKASTQNNSPIPGHRWLQLEVETETNDFFSITLHYNDEEANLAEETVINGAKYVRIGAVSDE